MEEKSKAFRVYKKINQPAKIIGLYYNTFFVFVLTCVFIIMVFSSKFKFMGLIYGLFVIMPIYLILFFYQTKYGPKRIAKIFNNLIKPINLIKMKKSIKKLYKK